MIYAQYALLALFIFGTLINLKYSIEGRPKKDPEGFDGVVLLIVISLFGFYLYYLAGSFSLIF